VLLQRNYEVMRATPSWGGADQRKVNGWEVVKKRKVGDLQTQKSKERVPLPNEIT